MKHTNSRSGFTLLELLTVIAIIAILAGVLFPVFKAVKDNAKRSSCIANLHDIGVGLQQYKLDNRVYPDALLARYTDTADMRTMAEARGGLYPEYVRSIKAFTCPNASAMGRDTPTPDGKVMQHWAGIGSDSQVRVYFFEGDSYDWTDVTGNGGYFATYQTTWAPEESYVAELTPNEGVASDDDVKVRRDFARQLAWRSPDANTVVTWCMNHEGGGSRALVLFLDASVDTISMEKMTPKTVPGGENILWRVLP